MGSEVAGQMGRRAYLGARLAAIHDRLAPVHLESVVEERQALLLLSVPAVCQPTVRLQQDGGPQVLILIPPVRGARRRAARAQDALVEAWESKDIIGE